MATKMSLKLLVDKSRNKVLFAESGKDFVDFLFSLMSLPLGTIVRLLTPTQTTTGCVGNLYSSLENLDNIYIQPNVNKSLLLEPKIGSGGNEMQLLLDSDGSSKSQSTAPVRSGGGYVKEVVTYMITDDLDVKPMSTISSIIFLNKYDVKDIGALEDIVVHLGTKEGLDLLRASLQSKSVLTDVFLKGTKLEPSSSSPKSPKSCPTQ